MSKSKPYLRQHDNGVYYVHWTENRVGKRQSTKCHDHSEAKAYLRQMRDGSNEMHRGTGEPLPRNAGDKRIYVDDAEIAAMRRDPVLHSKGRVVSARSKLTLLMLQYEDAVVAKKQESKLAILRIRILLARAELSRQFTLYEDTKAIAFGEPLAPPDCDRVLWPHRSLRRTSGHEE